MLSDFALGAVGFRTAVGLLALVATIQWIVLPTLAQGFRQHMFEVRRELFCFMKEGGVGADEQAYVLLRRTINSLIRFAERITFMRGLVMALLFRGQGRDYALRMESAIDCVANEASREKLRHFRRLVDARLIAHVACTSPLAWAFIVFLLVQVLPRALRRVSGGLLMASWRLAKASLRIRMPVDSIQMEAEMETGSSDSLAHA